MSSNLNPYYRCTRKRIPRALLTVGTCFCFRPIRIDAVTPTFVRKVVSVDYSKGLIFDHYGHSHLLSERLVYICLPR